MCLGNIQAMMKVLVVDDSGGLVLGAIGEHLGGFGKILNAHMGPHPSIKIFEMFNFTAEQKAVVSHFPLQLLPGLSQQPKYVSQDELLKQGVDR
jgi:hypothetical protein